MWIATASGFYSAVEHRTDTSLLTVRCRHLADAKVLSEFLAEQGVTAEPVAYAAADYPWRVFTPRTHFAAFLAREALAIDYGNFKEAVTARQGRERHDVYSSVWAVLLRIEKLPGALKGHTKAAKKAAKAGIARPPLFPDAREYDPPAGGPRPKHCACGARLTRWDVDDVCVDCEFGTLPSSPPEEGLPYE